MGLDSFTFLALARLYTHKQSRGVKIERTRIKGDFRQILFDKKFSKHYIHFKI